jgi:hypothetical protein
VKKGKLGASLFVEYGAGKESRTLDLNLGKVALYQLSYSRILTPSSVTQIRAVFGGGKTHRAVTAVTPKPRHAMPCHSQVQTAFALGCVSV